MDPWETVELLERVAISSAGFRGRDGALRRPRICLPGDWPCADAAARRPYHGMQSVNVYDASDVLTIPCHPPFCLYARPTPVCQQPPRIIPERKDVGDANCHIGAQRVAW